MNEQGARALVSSKLTGVEKSEEHKASIGSALRRRHAAGRVLRSVETLHREASVAGTCQCFTFAQLQIGEWACMCLT